MPGEIKIDTENQLIRVYFGSESTVDSWKKALVQVERLSEETGVFRVIVDVRKQTNLSNTMTLFEFGTHLPRSMAFAVLCELHIKNHQFIENVATNRGITVKDFDTEQEAIEWIKIWPNRIIGIDNK